MISLYPDQSEFLDRLRQSLTRNQSIIACSPPGSGKTVVAAAMVYGAWKKRRSAIMAVHRKDLLTQLAKTFDKFGIPYGYIAAGHSPNPFAAIQIATVGTLANRMERYNPDLFIQDEAHGAGAPSWSKIINHYRGKGAKIVGLSGSPERGDGKPLDHLFDDLVEGQSPQWLIDNGRLAQYRPFAPSSADLEGIRSRGGDYVADDLAKKFDKPSIIGDAVSSWGKFARGMRTAIYAFSIEHSKHIAATFTANGVPVSHMDGETPTSERRKIIMDLAMGRIQAISSCELMTTGFDLSSQVDMDVPIQCGLFLRPTQSLPLAMQMLMRPMRKQEGKAVLLDHVNLFATHGLPSDDREWQWRGREARGNGGGERTLPTATCEACFAVFKPAPTCPYCGHVRETHAREIEQVDGELVELDVERLRLQKHQEFVAKKIEERSCTTLAEWQALAKARGHQIGWAFHRFKAQSQRKRS